MRDEEKKNYVKDDDGDIYIELISCVLVIMFCTYWYVYIRRRWLVMYESNENKSEERGERKTKDAVLMFLRNVKKKRKRKV